ncbi:MAG: hypothetical protein QM650_11935 [Microlunatus sp.]
MAIHDTSSAAGPTAGQRSAAPIPVVPTRVDRLVRADDQLSLTLEFLNLDVDSARRTLVAVDPLAKFTGVRLVFGSQHTVEQTIGAEDDVPADGIDHRAAAESRLVVALPTGTPYALKSILDLAGRALALDERAVPGRKPPGRPAEPSPEVTALELVDSLVFSPEPDGRFAAGVAPVTRADVTELWRTRLLPNADTDTGTDNSTQPAKLRAIWSRPGDTPADRPLTADVRSQIVAATTVDPAEAIEVNQLWLTTHGSFIDLSGAWATGQLARYLHRAAAGRDLYVETAQRGFLAPFGIPAAITTVTERLVRDDASGNPVAVLVQQDFLSISATPVPFPAPHMPQDGRGIPFTQVIASDPGAGPVALASVTLDDGTQIGTDKIGTVTRDGVPVTIGYRATDRTGRTDIAFTMPAIFVASDHAFTVQDTVNGVPTPLGLLSTFFADHPAELELGGQPIGWADPHPAGRAGSSRSTRLIRLALDRPDLAGSTAGAVRADLITAGRPAFYPRVSSARVSDDAVAALVGGSDAIEVTYAAAWLAHGNGPRNPGLAFHTLATPTTLDRPGAGQGLIRPSLRIDTFSQTLGSGIAPTAARIAAPDRADFPAREDFPANSKLPVQADAAPPILSWDPKSALGDAARLFGSIALDEIVEQVNIALDDLGGDTGLPTIETLIEEEGIGYLLRWQPKLKTFRVAGDPVFVIAEDLASAGLPAFFGSKATSTANIELSQFIPLTTDADDGGATDTDFELTLDNVTLRLPPGAPAIAIAFRRVRYHDPGDGNAGLDTDLADWRFIEVLEFLEPVREFIVGLLDLGDIEIDSGGVRAEVDIPVPKLSFGVINVTGLNVGLALDLPNEGSSTIGFNLSRRDDPFRITLMGFGGSGSLEVRMVADDLDFLLGSLAVTYELAASIVVVSASLSASLGIELTYEDSTVTLGAYVELAGNASVLGLVNITGKVLLSLLYHLDSKLLRGTAQLTAEVDTPFSKSDTSWRQTVEVSLAADDSRRRSLAATLGSGPSFGDRFTAEQWAEYCAAYA